MGQSNTLAFQILDEALFLWAVMPWQGPTSSRGPPLLFVTIERILTHPSRHDMTAHWTVLISG